METTSHFGSVRIPGLKKSELAELQLALALAGEPSVSDYFRRHVRSLIAEQKLVFPAAFKKVHPHHRRIILALEELGAAGLATLCQTTRLNSAEAGTALRHLVAVKMVIERVEQVPGARVAGRPRKLYRLNAGQFT